MSKINNVIYDDMGQFIRFHSIGSNFRKASILHHQALVRVQELPKVFNHFTRGDLYPSLNHIKIIQQ